ncbi:6-phosphogluconolactonase [Amycolatopsis saalfeldensis]|uniref:6-phosphogluconolactonase n=1 Tax=Amycolatopsis saalfeldensis TaxID=394193 RepID=A0A1H8XVQ5_9PSEU|nr:6-phosphogluconolactonase [Amycolatopsis saalfeldensis]SEP43965.1 6-phosphogluconolactonase [Amycolatopsis saalfeldensis]
MSRTEVVVYANGELLAAAAAARLVTRIVDIQAAKGSASVGLTGGGTGIAVLRELKESSARDAIDWSRLDLYWGDERFVPADSDERNEKQAREALLDHVPLDPKRVYAMAPSDGEFGDDVDAAAAAYAEVLAANASADGTDDGSGVPAFDIMMLGLGGEGHTASVFPDSPAVHDTGHSVVAVRDCPKPPPTRVSLTLPAIRRAREVWLMTAGEAKAEAVSLALSGADETQVPVSGARGYRRTLWLLDRTAAGKLTKVYQTPNA